MLVSLSKTRSGRGNPHDILLSDVKKTSDTLKLAQDSIRLTHLDKPFWTRPRITKRDVINYYYQVAPVLLPHLKDRPLTLKRYPHGSSRPFFYQKRAPKNPPGFVRTVLVHHHEGPVRYVMVNNLATLLWLANLDNLELHPWYSRKGSLNRPDYVVFDLDPSKPRALAGPRYHTTPRGPKAVRQVALLIKDVLDSLDLVSLPKSSGSRGLHIYVPTDGRASYTLTKNFAEQVRLKIHKQAPRLTTLEFHKAKRHGIYIDYLQNVRGKTLASVYSLRARPGASVAAPLTWHEVKKGFKIRDFNITSMPARIQARGDLFERPAGSILRKQNIDRALRTLRNL